MSNARQAASTCAKHRGLTLVEVMLVLALLVVIGAIAVPTLQGSISRAALYSGGDLLRGAWAQARLTAMQSGEPRVFRFEPNGGRYQIVALNELGAPAAAELSVNNSEDEDNPELLRISKNHLPDGIIFSGGDVSASAQVLATIPSASEGPWSQPILFFPDGTTSDASLLLANDRKLTIRVTLRGLTGISQVADVDEVTP